MIDRLRRAARDLLGVSFHRGLALGALVGAAIAGSTLWTRLREAQRPAREGGKQHRQPTTQPRGQDQNGRPND